MKRILVWLVSTLTIGVVLGDGQFRSGKPAPHLFPFTISYDAKTNVVNVSHLIEAPAGKHGFVRVEGAHFVTDAGPIRFHATNLTGPANFPAPADAEQLAARLARLGINCVRFHFMDTWYVNFMPRTQGILADDASTQRKLDPRQLRKLDYLLAQLKARGIYVNLNLHVGRTLDMRDGVPSGSPWANKCVGQFMPRMIELQKEYASDLLNHVNPFTHNAWKDEPAVAMIEISNEDSLTWGVFSLHGPFKEELTRQWNVWLRKTYPTVEDLRKAWSGDVKACPLGVECVTGGTFDGPTGPLASSTRQWTQVGNAQATFKVADGLLRVNVAQPGSDFMPKLFHAVALEKGVPYTLKIQLRRTSGKGDKLSCAVASLKPDWHDVGLREMLPVSSEWHTITRVFIASETTNEAFIQLTQFPKGTIEIDDVSLRRGATAESLARLEPYQNYARGRQLPLVTRGDSFARRRDFYRFLTDTERAYWLGMRDHIKNTIGAKQPVSGTQLGFSPQTVQAQLDYVDNHAYWQHPSGAAPAGWIVRDSKARWSVGSDAMVNSLDCALGLAASRVAEKPYTISEYNHPPPNPYGAEGQPILAAVAAYQDWSGIFQYSYNHYPTNYAPTGNPWCIFDSIARTEVLAHFPACAAMFLRGDVPTAKGAGTRLITADEVLDAQAKGSGNTLTYRPREEVLARRVGVGIDASAIPVTASAASDSPFVWNRSKPGKAFFTVNTPNAKLFTGFPEGRTVKLGDVTLAVGKTSLNWATVSLFSKDATGFGAKGKASILVAATAAAGNADQVVRRVDARHVTLPEHGTGPVVAEGVPFTLTLPAAATRVKCWALNPDGSRKGGVPVVADGANARIVGGPEFRTVWYEIEIQ